MFEEESNYDAGLEEELAPSTPTLDRTPAKATAREALAKGRLSEVSPDADIGTEATDRAVFDGVGQHVEQLVAESTDPAETADLLKNVVSDPNNEDVKTVSVANQMRTEFDLVQSVGQLRNRRKSIVDEIEKQAMLITAENSKGSALEALGGAAADVIAPTTYKELTTSFGTALDLDPGIWDGLTAGSFFQEVRKELEGLHDDERNRVIGVAVNDLWSRAGNFAGGENDFQFWTAVQAAKAMLDQDEPDVALNNTFAALSLNGFGSLIGTGLLTKGVRSVKRFIFPGSTADAAANTSKGVDQLIKSLKSENADDILNVIGATPEGIVEELVVPGSKFHNAAPNGRPSVPDAWLGTEGKEISKKLITDLPGQKLGKGTVKTKINDSIIDDSFDGGYNYTLRAGTASGKNFKTEAKAKKAAKVLEGGGYGQAGVVKTENGEYLIEVQGTHFNTLDDLNVLAAGKGDVAKTGLRSIAGWVNKDFIFNQEFSLSSTAAAIDTGKIAIALDRSASVYKKASVKDKVAVNRVIRKYEGKKWLGRKKLAKEGLTPNQIAAYLSFRNTSKKVHRLRNEFALEEARSKGFLSYRTEAGSWNAKPIQSVGDDVQEVIDMSTGSKVAVAELDEGDQLVKILGGDVAEDGSRWNFGVIRKGSSPDVSEITGNLVHEVKGYAGRVGTAPYYVTKVVEQSVNGVKKSDSVVTVGAAGSRREAEKLAQKFAAMDEEGASYGSRPAKEIDVDHDDGFGLLDDLDNQGILATRNRRTAETPITDEAGNPLLLDMESALDQMMQSTAIRGGLGRWADAAAEDWKRTYGSLYEEGSSLLRRRRKRAENLGPGEQKLAKEAEAVARHLENIMGVSKSQTDGAIRETASAIGDGFLEIANTLEKLSGNRVGATLRNIGMDFIDGGSRGVNQLKTVAYATHLATNAPRQRLLQMTMIPSYIGSSKEGLKYFASGKAAQELALIRGYYFGADIHKAAKQLKYKGNVDELIADWEKAGITTLVDQHHFQAGFMSNSYTATKGRTRAGVDLTVNQLKKYGIDAGIKDEKAVAWLVTRNDAIKAGDWSATTIGKYTAKAEAMTGNLNSSNPALIQKGAIGAVLQYQSHQLTMAGRLLGLDRVTPAARRMAVAPILVAYGTQGLGIDQLAGAAGLNGPIDGLEDWWRETFNHPEDWEMPKALKIAMEQGLAGLAVSSALSAVEGEFKSYDFSSKFSPIGGLASLGVGVFDYARGLFSGSDTLGVDISAMPAVALPKQLAGVLGFVAEMNGVGFGKRVVFEELPEGTYEEALTRTLKAVPVTNNLVKAWYAANLGEVRSGYGGTILNDVGYGTAMGAIFGIPPTEQSAIYEARKYAFGEYNEANQGATDDALEAHIKDIVNTKIIPILASEEDDEKVMEAALTFAKDHGIIISGIKDEYEQEKYRSYFNDQLYFAVQRLGNTTKENLLKRLEEFGSTGSMVSSDAAFNIIENYDDEIDGLDEVKNVVRFWRGDQ